MGLLMYLLHSVWPRWITGRVKSEDAYPPKSSGLGTQGQTFSALQASDAQQDSVHHSWVAPNLSQVSVNMSEPDIGAKVAKLNLMGP